MKLDIAQVLNGRLGCTSCQTSKSWVATARTAVRQYSSVHRLRCQDCGQQIVAKVVGGEYSSGYARVHARKEYEALCTLQSVFPQDERYGTLIPLGHLEWDGRGIVVTRLAPGQDLTHYLRTLDAASAEAACRSSGVWLKKLHESDVHEQRKCLGTEDKISFLADTYGTDLHADPTTEGAYELFAQCGSQLDVEPVFAVRQHGDFKPENLLCDGTRYIGLDIRWRTIGAAVYDLAPFLNHLWLGGRVARRHRTRRIYEPLESAFLSGYGDVGDLRVLRWAQLYFALCYMGKYRQRGRLGGGFANWKVRPLVRNLVAQIREAA